MKYMSFNIFIENMINKVRRYYYLMRRMCVKCRWIIKTPFIKSVPNQLLFRTYQDKYTCNLKYLSEEFIKSGLECKIIWVYSSKTENDLSQFPEQVELVKFGTNAYYKAVAESKVWINNAHNFTWEFFPKRKDQIFINLWHGSLGLKRIDAEADSNKKRQRAGKRAGKITDYCISNSEFEEMVFRTSYWPNTKYLRFGHCRNDLMFSDKQKIAELKKHVCEKLGIDINKKILLYAPTFRDGTSIECFDIDYNNLKKTLENKFGGEWIILSRLHFHTLLKLKEKAPDIDSSQNYVISANDYDDMQELLAVSDIGITDYSSWICDFVLTGRPGFLFVTDIDTYVTERGFYYPLEDTPFPIARNNQELMQNIRDFDANFYSVRTKEYLEKLGCNENGNASLRIVEWLKAELRLK